MNANVHSNQRAKWLLPLCVVVAVCLRPATLPARTIVEAGSDTVWGYLDDGVAPDVAWRKIGYDDSQWKSGAAPLGFGESRLTTQLNPGVDPQRRTTTYWFRREFDPPQLESGESLVVLLCVDDGAVVSLNGQEIGRVNMPVGLIRADTLAQQTIGNPDEGLYQRLRFPAKLLMTGRKNVLGVEVHQASATSSDLFFDLALKVVPAEAAANATSSAAMQIVKQFNKEHYLGPGVKIPDGYIDGGRRMKIDAGGNAASGREILMVDRPHDTELAADLSFARSSDVRALPPLERIQKLAARIDQETTPPGSLRWVGKTTELVESEFTNKPVLIGDWVDQCQAGVCRHRALLFKVLADEAGLRSALVRGNYARKGPPEVAHAWNEVQLDNGQRVLVDVMHHGGKPVFPRFNDPGVIQHYLKVDGTPWYSAQSK